MRKLISICGVAAVACCGLGAVAVASAQAFNTTLCETSGSPCASPYPARTYEASGNMLIAVGADEVTCSSSIEFETTASSGAPLKAKVFSYTLTGCADNGSSCQGSIILGAPFEAEIEWAPSSFDIVPGSGGTSPEYKFSCGTTDCQYTANPVPMTFAGGAPAMLLAEVPLTRSPRTLFCPSTAGSAIELEFTAPSEVFVEHT